MPSTRTVPIVDASAPDRTARRRRVGLEHLALALVLLALYGIAVLLA
ncbi:hypothetical protein [Nocardioides sp. AX2bis]|nr:hypothetical protein [Nocardioides sp. AX2bis]VXC50360.1 hypothetical protein NOCARDAX2BIS_730004 [Nocardioides sp. AX2bis]